LGKGGLTGKLMRKLLPCSQGEGMLPGGLRQSFFWLQRKESSSRAGLVGKGQKLLFSLCVIGSGRRV
jgi:hypothetical protein